MYLIFCKNDNSYCIINDNAVICDEESVKEGDAISFVYSKKHLQGTVIKISDDDQELNKELQKLKKNSAKSSATDSKHSRSAQKKSSQTKNDKSMSKGDTKNDKGSGKRSSKTKKVEKKLKKIAKNLINEQVSNVIAGTVEDKTQSDPDNDGSVSDASSENIDIRNPNKKKKYDDEKKKDIETLSTLSSAESVPASPSKEDLKKIIKEMMDEKARNNLLLSGNTPTTDNENAKVEKKENLVADPTPDDSQKVVPALDGKKMEFPQPKLVNDFSHLEKYLDEGELHKQLFGENCGSVPMVLLANGIYCKKTILDEALNTSLRFSHLIRRILGGVFNPAQLENVTATGQAPRAVPNEQKKEKYQLLHPTAKKVIIDYASKHAEEKNWEIPNRRMINSIISQRLTELKLQNKQNLTMVSKVYK